MAPLTLNWSCAQHLKNPKCSAVPTVIRCHPSTEPSDISLPCTFQPPNLPTNIYHASPVPRRFQTPTPAFHCCTLAAPKASTPFKQHFDKHMVNSLRLYMRILSCISTLHIFHFTSSDISSVMPRKIITKSQNLNRFFSV